MPALTAWLWLAACTPDPTDAPGELLPTGRITLGEERVCAAPGVGFELWEAGDWPDRPNSGAGQGLAAGDLDGDGVLDLLLPSAGGVRLYLGRPDGPVDATDRLPPAAAAPYRAASVADADGDGDLDGFLGGREIPDLLLRNDGAGNFSAEEITAGPRTLGSSWGDVDGDGDLDLAVANGAHDTAPGLFLNRGDGTFEDRSDLLPPGFLQGDTFLLTLADLDGDGDPDLYRVNDFLGRVGNALAWNEGGAFRADGGTAGLDVAICAMGLGLGDVDGDGLPDLALSDCEDLWLFESSPLGIWADTAGARGLRTDPASARQVPWGMELVDVDNDGDLDLGAAYGFIDDPDWEVQLRQRDGLYLQGEDGRFAEVSSAWGLEALGNHRGFLLTDLDGDGWADWVKQDLQGRARWYRQRCGEAAWLTVHLRQEGPNPFAVGAKVVARDGDRAWTTWIRAGGTSLASGGPPEARFGLADADAVDLEVTFPDGTRAGWADVPTRRAVWLSPP